MGQRRVSRSKSPLHRGGVVGRRSTSAPSAMRAPAGAASPAASLQRALRLGHTVVQTKLTLGPASDTYERQADAVARQVMRTISSPGPEAAAEPAAPAGVAQRQPELEDEDVMPKRVQRQPELEDEDVLPKRLQRSTMLDGGPLSADVESGIESARSGGRPLDDAVRAKMEPAFGADFGGVRVHTGSRSDGLNQSLQSRAFTTGSDIFFRGGEYQPANSGGQELLAHELTHVVQQGAAG